MGNTKGENRLILLEKKPTFLCSWNDSIRNNHIERNDYRIFLGRLRSSRQKKITTTENEPFPSEQTNHNGMYAQTIQQQIRPQ